MNHKTGQKVMVVHPPTAGYSAITYMSTIERATFSDPPIYSVRSNVGDGHMFRYDHRGRGITTSSFIIFYDELKSTCEGEV